jgi:CheY-like chemotaxis protein
MIKKMALVDDDLIFQFGFQLMLNEVGNRVELQRYQNGEEFVDFLTQENNTSRHPEMVFLDLEMPKMDGWEVLRKLPQLAAEKIEKMKIFICTSSINPQDIYRAKEIPEVKEYLIKPLILEKLKRILTD